MSKNWIERMRRQKDHSTAVLDHLKPFLNESRSLRVALLMLLIFTVSVLVLAVWFKVLEHYMDVPMYEGGDSGGDGAEKGGLFGMVAKLRKSLGGRSDLELQRLLQSSSSIPGLIFTLVGFVAIYATNGALTRLLMGLVGLGSQVVFLTWIYVESWGEFTNSFILTGSLITSAFSMLSPAKCPSLVCLEDEHSWEPMLITCMFFFILATSLLHIFLASAVLLGILKMDPKVLQNRIYKTLDYHLSYKVDNAVWESSVKKDEYVSESLLSEVVVWCMDEKYLGEMEEKVYRGRWRTQLRVVVTAIPTLVLAASAIYLKSSWLWGGVAAVALLVASCSAVLLGFFCVHQREHRLPLCFSRGIDIIESFENATSDLFDMNRDVYDTKKQEFLLDSDSLDDNTLTMLFEEKGINWDTCNYMVIQTLGLAELGHFEHQQVLWEIERKNADGKISVEYTDPNSNESLKNLIKLSPDVEGLKERRKRIMMALECRDPVKIGPTAISKIAGVMMAMRNTIQFLEKYERGHSTV